MIPVYQNEGMEIRSNVGPLPKYRCHKEVWALKIQSMIVNDDGSLSIMPDNNGYANFVIPAKFVPKHDAARPSPGWYVVFYENNYISFSPPDVFDGGYTLIEKARGAR